MWTMVLIFFWSGKAPVIELEHVDGFETQQVCEASLNRMRQSLPADEDRQAFGFCLPMTETALDEAVRAAQRKGG